MSECIYDEVKGPLKAAMSVLFDCRLTNKCFSHTKIESGCSHIGNLCPAVSVLDKLAGSHESKALFADELGLASAPTTPLDSTQSLQTEL